MVPLEDVADAVRPGTALVDRFRAGLSALGLRHAGSEASPIVAIPGPGDAVQRLTAANVRVAARAGGLRASFHLYNSLYDVERALEALAG